jgi:hypothetical protein
LFVCLFVCLFVDHPTLLPLSGDMKLVVQSASRCCRQGLDPRVDGHPRCTPVAVAAQMEKRLCLCAHNIACGCSSSGSGSTARSLPRSCYGSVVEMGVRPFLLVLIGKLFSQFLRLFPLYSWTTEEINRPQVEQSLS